MSLAAPRPRVDTRVLTPDPSARPEWKRDAGEGVAAGPEDLPRVDTRRAARADLPLLAGAAASAAAITWLVCRRLLPVQGGLGAALLLWYLLFLLVTAAVALPGTDGRALRDRLARTVVSTAGLITVTVLALIVGYTVYRGLPAVTHPTFFSRTMATTGATDPLDRGGALHAVVGTLLQVALAIVLSVPLGVATALFLNEVGGPLARPVRTVVDAMSALPSIIAGLFVLATLVLTLGLGRSGLAASVAIAVMMLPIITRTSEVVLRLVPQSLREAGLALGASQWRTVWTVVLPTARSGLATAVILGVARGIGETAPVLLTAGFTQELNGDPTHGPMLNLPLYVFTYVRLPPAPETVARAYGAATTLLVLVMSLFVLARSLGRRSPSR